MDSLKQMIAKQKAKMKKLKEQKKNKKDSKDKLKNEKHIKNSESKEREKSKMKSLKSKNKELINKRSHSEFVMEHIKKEVELQASKIKVYSALKNIFLFIQKILLNKRFFIFYVLK